MVAPKGPGHLVRREYADGRGVPVLVAVEQDATGKAWALALSYAKAHRRPARRRHQDHLHRGDRDRPVRRAGRALRRRRPRWCRTGFEMLTEAGYQPEVAYFECLHELKLIVDLMYEGGIAKQRWSVSDTAEYGDYVSGPRVIDDSVKEQMKDVLGRHPERRLRPALHRRPGRRRAGVQGAAGQGRAAPDRDHRPRAAQADELGQVARRRLHRGHRRPLTPAADDAARRRTPGATDAPHDTASWGRPATSSGV